MKRIRFYWPLAVVAVSLLLGPAKLLSQEPGGAASSTLTDAEKEEFLKNAKILKQWKLGVGITGTSRATLSDGKLTHDAHIQTIDEYKREFQGPRGTEFNFRDSYKYYIAAYKLDRLLNLNMHPVSVERKVAGTSAAVTWWRDHQMMEKDRYLNKIEPPDKAMWNDQIYQVRVFNELTYNTDPNLGNLLITDDWGVVLVDFGRAFRIHKKLRDPKSLSKCDRRVYEGLRRLDEETLMRELRPYLRKSEVQAIVARRDKILKFFDNEIAKKGEAAVICDMPGH